MRSTCALVAVVLSVLIAVPPVSAQEHVAGQQVLDAAVQQHVRAIDQDREAVQQFLQRSDVRAIAGKYGIDIRRAESAVATMNAADLASIAARARQADDALAGGASTVTISTTAIIIGLLVLILLIVALR
ncbi:MAG TPA: PA2779 family protein [Vicinamibacterales bacterium]|jgi:hypothetical protein|nr:PA2779 family protein [Vicinamibacterales bacterium]